MKERGGLPELLSAVMGPRQVQTLDKSAVVCRATKTDNHSYTSQFTSRAGFRMIDCHYMCPGFRAVTLFLCGFDLLMVLHPDFCTQIFNLKQTQHIHSHTHIWNKHNVEIDSARTCSANAANERHTATVHRRSETIHKRETGLIALLIRARRSCVSLKSELQARCLDKGDR